MTISVFSDILGRKQIFFHGFLQGKNENVKNIKKKWGFFSILCERFLVMFSSNYISRVIHVFFSPSFCFVFQKPLPFAGGPIVSTIFGPFHREQIVHILTLFFSVML